MTTFDLWPIPLRGGARGAGTNIWHPETPASYESLPAPLATQIPTLWILTSGGEGAWGGSDIRSMSSIRPICKCWCPPLARTHFCWSTCGENRQPASICRQADHWGVSADLISSKQGLYYAKFWSLISLTGWWAHQRISLLQFLHILLQRISDFWIPMKRMKTQIILH